MPSDESCRCLLKFEFKIRVYYFVVSARGGELSPSTRICLIRSPGRSRSESCLIWLENWIKDRSNKEALLTSCVLTSGNDLNLTSFALGTCCCGGFFFVQFQNMLKAARADVAAVKKRAEAPDPEVHDS